MSTNSRHTAESLTFLCDKICTASIIDTAQGFGKIATSDVVMTSMGNVHKAIITPYYPAFQHDPGLFDRIQWAATFRRPLVEAAITVSEMPDGALRSANVITRLCLEPSLDGSTIMEAGYRFPLSQERTYGTMESVVDDISERQAGKGVEIPGRTGWICVPKIHSAKGKWTISAVEHMQEPYHAPDIPAYINRVVTKELFFVDNPVF